MRIFRVVCTLSIALLLGGVVAGSALADPGNAKKSFSFTIDCGTNGVFDVVVNGNGDFTPAHDLNSNRVLIPVAFGEFSFTITNPSGVVIDSGTDPAFSKGSSSPKGHTLIECTYFVTNTQNGFTFSGSGGVTGFIT